MHPFYMHAFVCGESAWQNTLNLGAVREILLENKENVCNEELTLYETFYESLSNSKIPSTIQQKYSSQIALNMALRFQLILYLYSQAINPILISCIYGYWSINKKTDIVILSTAVSLFLLSSLSPCCLSCLTYNCDNKACVKAMPIKNAWLGDGIRGSVVMKKGWWQCCIWRGMIRCLDPWLG